MTTVYTYCNNCFKENEHTKFEVRDSRKGHQIPVFRCSRCNGSTTKYVHKPDDLHKLMKVFVLCHHCYYLWKTRFFGRQLMTTIRCPKCMKLTHLIKAKNLFARFMMKVPQRVRRAIKIKYPQSIRFLDEHLEWQKTV